MSVHEIKSWVFCLSLCLMILCYLLGVTLTLGKKSAVAGTSSNVSSDSVSSNS